MFSTETPSHARSLRPKRTRQTTEVDDSMKQPLTKKRRSALRRDTFEPLTESSLNEIAGREKANEKQNGHTVESAKQTTRSTVQGKELTLRGGKKSEKRSERGGAVYTLSTNDFYTVAQLPTLPEQIRSRPSVPYSSVISPEYDSILALTHTDALVWSYNSVSSIPSSRNLLSFKIPFPPASTEDPLPLAAFTAKSAGDEPGIVVISPKWGKVVYWDTISNASSIVPGQSADGVQGSVPGMLSGETIQEIVNAEPAGFIITSSHGRVAHLTVRDQMGRPGIGFQFLRKTAAVSGSVGLFGSIRNAFGSDRRKGTPLVRAGRSAKGQRDVVIATEDGDFEFWNTNLSIGNAMTKSLNAKEQLQSSLHSQQSNAEGGRPVRFKILDFDLASTPATGHQIARRGDTDSTPMVILAAVYGQEDTRYYVIDMVFSEETGNIKVVHPVKYHISETVTSGSWRPRLSVSRTHPSAFILFDNAVVLMSLVKIMESPSSQLLGERASLPEPFQDCIKFQDETIYQILGYASEDQEKESSCVFAVQGFGIVRFTSHLQNHEEVEVDEVESRLSAKAKIEQAIFFGTKRDNPLELSNVGAEVYFPEEIRVATLEISLEILCSLSKYLPKTSSSIEEHMKLRAKALQDLAEYVLKHYPSCIPQRERFGLLWNAEKLAAAQAVWKVQENIQLTYPRKDDREMTYMNFTLRALHESRQKYPVPEKGETDHVRHWLTYSVFRMDHFVSELGSCLGELSAMDVNDPRIVCDYLIEIVDLWNAIYQAAFKFREDNAPVYGLGDEIFHDGVLSTGYPLSLPHVWTSDRQPLKFSQDIIEFVCRFCREWWDFSPALNSKTKKTKKMPTDVDGNSYEAPTKEALLDLSSRLPETLELFTRVVMEDNLQKQEIIKNREVDEEEKEKDLKVIRADARPVINDVIHMAAPYNREGTIALAEDLKDTGLLVELSLGYLADLARQKQQRPDEAMSIDKKVRGIQDHVETYFGRYGNAWAWAHFSSLVMRGKIGRLLTEGQADNGAKQGYLSWFFKKSSARGQQVGKANWINNVVGESNYSRAQKVLEKVAAEEETDVWNKKIELCLAKLTGLAAAEGASVGKDGHLVPTTALPDEVLNKSAKYDRQLEFLQILDSVSFHIDAAVEDAVDNQARLELAVQTFCSPSSKFLDKKSPYRRILTSVLAKVVAGGVLSSLELIDLLTLATFGPFRSVLPEQADQDPNVAGHEFALALQALDLADEIDTHSKVVIGNVIYRRLLIRDDWTVLNQTSGKSDQEVMLAMQGSYLSKTLLTLVDTAMQSNTEVRVPSIDDLFVVPTKDDSSTEEKQDSRIFLPTALKDLYMSQEHLKASDLDSLEKELRKENELLARYVAKCRLREHFGGTLRDSKEIVRRWYDRAGDRVEADQNEIEAEESNDA